MKKGFTGGLFLVLAYAMVLVHTFFPHVHQDNPFESSTCTVETSCHQDGDVVHRFLELMISVDTGKDHLQHFLSCSHAQQKEEFNEIAIKAFVSIFACVSDREESVDFNYAVARSESLPSNPFLSTSHALRAPPSLA